MHDNVCDNYNVRNLSSFPLLWLPLSQIAAAVRVKFPCRVYCGQNFQTLNFRAVAYNHIQISYTIHCTVHNILYIITNNYNNTPARIMCTVPYRYKVCLKSLEIVVSLSPYMEKFWIVMFDA